MTSNINKLAAKKHQVCLEKHLIVVHLTKSKLKKAHRCKWFYSHTTVKDAGWNRKRPRGMRLSQTQLITEESLYQSFSMHAEKAKSCEYIRFTCMLARFPLPVAVESEGLNGCPNFPEKNIEFWRSNMEPSSQSQRWCPLVWKETWIIWWSQRKFDGYWCQQFHN